MSETIYRKRDIEVALFNGGVRGPCVQIDASTGADGYVQMTEAQFLDLARVVAAEIERRRAKP